MRPSSSKAKGRRASQEIKEILLKRALELEPDDIVVTSSGDTGEDLKLSPRARKIFPICIEAKNQEKLNIWDAIKQAQSHCTRMNCGPEYPDYEAVVAFKRNNHPLMACVSLDFLAFLLVKANGQTCDTAKT